MSRLLTPQSGQVLLDGKDIHKLPARELARAARVLPQGPVTPEGITAAELVSRGRHPHRGLFGRLTAEDDAAIDEALAAVELTELRERSVDQLSGVMAAVWIAMVLAHRPAPAARRPRRTWTWLRGRRDERGPRGCSTGRTVVTVLHDLTLAAQYADHPGGDGRGQDRG